VCSTFDVLYFGVTIAENFPLRKHGKTIVVVIRRLHSRPIREPNFGFRLGFVEIFSKSKRRKSVGAFVAMPCVGQHEWTSLRFRELSNFRQMGFWTA
jgi:hypothetical protein